MSFQENIKNQCVRNLYVFSQTGNLPDLKKIIEEKDFSLSTLDLALRELISKFDSSKKEYIECAKVILKHTVDINYKNKKDFNTTILMKVCAKGDLALIQTIFEFESENNEKKKKIDITIKDSNNYTFIHHVFESNSNEIDATGIIDYFCKKPNLKSDVIALMKVKDNNGDIPLCYSLRKGWFKLSKKYIELVGITGSGIYKDKDNLLHCAVKGKSLLCVKMILYYSTTEMFKMKNTDGYTPLTLAKHDKLSLIEKVIERYESNYKDETFKKCFDIRNERFFCSCDLIEKFDNEEYSSVVSYLNQCQLEQTIVGSEATNKSIEWNILLTKTKMYQKSEKVPLVFPYEEEYVKFFEKFTKLTQEQISSETSPIDIIFFNKIVFLYKTNDSVNLISTIYQYLTEVYKVNESNYYKWIVYVNVTLVLIEEFISLGYYENAHILLVSFNQHLLQVFEFFERQRQPDSYAPPIDKLAEEYLNKIGVFNQFSDTWTELFCYIKLLTAVMNIDMKESFKVYKHLIKNCKYLKKFEFLFSRLNLLYLVLKVKMHYHNVNYSKCFKKLEKLKKEDADKVLYYNSLGILSLKLKKFSYAEYQFRTALSLIKENFLEVKVEYICAIKYNLALSLFYQKRFLDAKKILKPLTKVKRFNTNIFLWYRLGLCNVELALRRKNFCESDIVKDIVFTSKKRKKDKVISVDLLSEEENSSNVRSSSDDKYDDLYAEFERSLFNTSDMSDEISVPSTPTAESPNRKVYILNSSTNESSTNKGMINFLAEESPGEDSQSEGEILSEAIEKFKKVILLSGAGNALNGQKLDSIIKLYNKDQKSKTKERFNNKNIIISSYMNLFFCFSLRKEWNQLLFYIKHFFMQKYKITNDIVMKIQNYKIEALINLNKNAEAEAMIKKIMENNCDSYKFEFFSRGNSCKYKDIYFKLNLYFGLCLISIKNKHIKQAEEYIKIITNNFFKDKKNIPPFLLRLIIYINLIKFNDDGNIRHKNNALKIIQTKEYIPD